MSANPISPPDTITMTCVRPAQNQTITVVIPAGMVAMLDWLAGNVKNADGNAKYLYGLNVIWADVIGVLLPAWSEAFISGQVAPLQDQVDTERQAIQAQVAAVGRVDGDRQWRR